MRKIGSLILMILTLWPPLYFVVFGIFFFDQVVGAVVGNPDLKLLYAVHIVTIFVVLGLLVLYSVHLYKNKQVAGEQKMLWLLGFIFLNGLIFPFYWWRHHLPSATVSKAVKEECCDKPGRHQPRLHQPPPQQHRG